MLEFRLVDGAGIFCSNSATFFLHKTDVQHSFAEKVMSVRDRVVKCVNCVDENLTCNYDDSQFACSNCIARQDLCLGFYVAGTVVDMASAHKAANDFLEEKDCHIVYAIYHVIKALTNATRNNTAILKDCYFSSQLLMSLFNTDEYSAMRRLPREVFIGKDRQSDSNSYLYISSDTQSALAIEQFHLFQRYPDRYQIKKSAHQIKLQGVKQTLVNRNGEPIILQFTGELLVVPHGVYSQILTVKPVLQGQTPDPILQDLQNITLAVMYGQRYRKFAEYLAVVDRDSRRLFIYLLPRAFTGSKSQGPSQLGYVNAYLQGYISY